MYNMIYKKKSSPFKILRKDPPLITTKTNLEMI